MSAVNANEVVAYGKLIRPSTNRISHWHYFGFPADNNNTILSREHIICVICKAAFIYNARSTDDLKGHLKKTHPDVTELLAATTGQIASHLPPAEKTGPVKKRAVSARSARSNSSTAYSDTDYMIEHLTEEASDDHEIIEYLMPEENIDEDMDKSTKFKRECEDDALQNSTTPRSVTIRENRIIYDEQIAEMCILDLLPANVVEGTGFNQLLLAMNRNVLVPTSHTINKKIQKSYETEKNKVKNKPQSNRPFAMLIDKWTNFEQHSYLTASLSYIVNSRTIKTAYWLTMSSPNTVDELQQHLVGLNMEFCSAVVVNFDIGEELALQEFLTINDIPVVECFSEIIRRSATRCFAHPEVHDIIARITEFLSENSNTVSSSWREPPVLHSHIWMTTYNYLEYFRDLYQTVFETSDETLNEMVVQIKSILECLSPFKVALETISLETKPLASVIKPLTQQLLDNHFTSEPDDSSIVIDIKNIVQEEFRVSILNRKFLSVASFLDPRFQNLVLPSDLETVKEEVRKLCPKTEERPSLATKSGSSQRKAASGLSFFFNKRESQPTKKTRDRIDVEFDAYNADAEAELEQCPLAWWQQNSSSYPNLKVAANSLCCVPAIVQSVTVPLNQQILRFNNRMTMSTISNINMTLFLHHNRQQSNHLE